MLLGRSIVVKRYINGTISAHDDDDNDDDDDDWDDVDFDDDDSDDEHRIGLLCDVINTTVYLKMIELRNMATRLNWNSAFQDMCEHVW